MKQVFSAAFESRQDLLVYGSNALLLFALQLRFQISDIHATADAALTDGPDDKKCDLIYIDAEAGEVVVAQAWHSTDDSRKAAKANKAADLNTAVSWLITADIEDIPSRIRPAAVELRQALDEGKIRVVEFWFVHNVPESDNVKIELDQVAKGARSAIQSRIKSESPPECKGLEVGRERLSEWYKSLTVPILVAEELTFSTTTGAFSVGGDGWHAIITAVPADWLHNLFSEYGTSLFSANVRHYLGSRKSASNINHGIKNTAESEPSRLWKNAGNHTPSGLENPERS